MPQTAWFSAATLKFLTELRSHNNREWFAENKARYEDVGRDAMLGFIASFGPELKKFAPGFVADPRPSGGSMFRIYRDTRFGKDKSPYKTNLAARFAYGGGCDDGSNSFGYYFHLEPGGSFAAAGLWRPDGPALAAVRQAIVDRPDKWKVVLRTKQPVEGDQLVRPPKGFPPEHPFIEDLKRKDFVSTVRFSDRDVTGPGFLTEYAAACRKMTPLMKFLAGGLGKDW